MFIACAIASLVLAAMLTMSASFKLRKHEDSVRVINGTVGVPLRLFPALAGLELAAALGVVVGLWLAPLGIAAALGATLYMALAVAAHVRVGDLEGTSSPLVPLVVAVVVLVLRTATA